MAFRLLALVAALLGSLSAPALALTHGLTHEHLAASHAFDAPHAVEARPPVSAPVAFGTDEEHAHAHPTLGVAADTRDTVKPDVTLAPSVVVVPPALSAPRVLVVRAPAITDRALLARPAPPPGAPPSLRAPPAR